MSALIAPCRVEIPRDHIAIFAAAPLILIPVALIGELGVLSAIVLILLFVAFVAYVAYREYHRAIPTFRSAEVLESLDHPEARAVTGNRFDTRAGAPGETRVPTDLARLSAGGVGARFRSVWMPCSTTGEALAAGTLEQFEGIHRIQALYPVRTALALTADDIEEINGGGGSPR